MMKKVVVASIMTAVVLMLTFTLVLPTDGEGADNYTDVTDTDPIEATLNESHSGCGCVEAGEIIYTLDEKSLSATVVNPSEHPQAELPYSTYSGEITIPSEIKYKDQDYIVTSIGLQAFCQSPRNGGGPTAVILPEGLTTISEKAFENCTNLSSITLPSTLTTIGEGAFYGCSGLNELTIPAGVTDLGFEYRSITGTEHANLSFGALEGWLKDPEGWSNVSFSEGSQFEIDGDMNVLYRTIDNQKELVYLIDNTSSIFTIGSDVTSIGTGAFYDKNNLNTILFDEGSKLTSIGEGAFAYSGITTINLPSTIGSIGVYAFENCGSLTKLLLPANVDLSTSVNGYPAMGALAGWLDITKILDLDGNIRYTIDNGILYDRKVLLKVFDSNITELIVKEGTTSVHKDAFNDLKKLSKATIPADLIVPFETMVELYKLSNGNLTITGQGDYSIEDGVLYNGNILVSVVDKETSEIHIREGTTELYMEAFKGSYASSVVIPETVTKIGERSFQDSFISGLYIPKSVNSIGIDAFAGITAILVFEGELPDYSETDVPEDNENYLYIHYNEETPSNGWNSIKRVSELDSILIDKDESGKIGSMSMTITGDVPKEIMNGTSTSFKIEYESKYLVLMPSFALSGYYANSEDGSGEDRIYEDLDGRISIKISNENEITISGLSNGTCKCSIWANVILDQNEEPLGCFAVLDLDITVGERATVNFDLNGVGGTVNPIESVTGATVTVPPIPEGVDRVGYTFVGWNDNKDGTGNNYSVGDELVVMGSTTTLFAKWTINQYTITFNTNGGSTVNPITQNYGSLITAPSNPTKSGYTFVGWDPAIPGTVPANDLTIYAKWIQNYIPPSSGGTTTPPKDTTVIDKNPDGSSTETKTENKTNSDGSKTETVTVTDKDKDGNVTGSSKTETTTSTKKENGSTITSESTTTTKKDADGNVTGSTTSSTTKTESSTTTTIVEKEEVKDADDNVTSSTEKTTETVKIDGGTLVSEKTEVTDASGNVTTTENIKAESKDGTVKTTVESDDSATTVSTVITTFGKVDDRIIDMAIAQSDAVSDKVSEDSHSKVIQIDTGSDSSSAEVSLSPESLSAIAEKGAEFKVVCKTGTMQLDKDVIGTLTNPKKDVTVTMYEPTDSDLTEAQVSAKGDRFGVSMHAVVGEDRYHMLGGKVTVTIPYVIDAYSDSDYGIFYIDEQGMRTFMNSVYDEVTKAFIFETDHFSLFVVDEVPAPAEDSDNTLLYVGIVVVLIVVIAIAAFLIRKH